MFHFVIPKVQKEPSGAGSAFFDFSKNIEQDVYHNGEQNSSKKAVTLLHGKY